MIKQRKIFVQNKIRMSRKDKVLLRNIFIDNNISRDIDSTFILNAVKNWEAQK